MWRTVVGVDLILHGLVHVIGFVVAWRITALEGFAYRTDAVGGIDLGSSGVKVLGMYWLVAALGFVTADVALLTRCGWWQSAKRGVAVVSLVLGIQWAQQAFAGVVTDVVIIATLVLFPRRARRLAVQ
jgi:hypothetical protein